MILKCYTTTVVIVVFVVCWTLELESTTGGESVKILLYRVRHKKKYVIIYYSVRLHFSVPGDDSHDTSERMNH